MYTQEKTFKNPIEEQRKAALEHYEQASRAANHWSSFVESAIKAYSPESCPPPVSAEVVSQLQNVYSDGFIYMGITPASFGRADHWNTESETEHNEAEDAYWSHVTSFPKFKVEGQHSFYNNQRVIEGNDFEIIFKEINGGFAVAYPSPSAPVVAEQVHKKSLAALDKLIKDQPELIEKINKELDNFGFEGPTISEYFASFGHSPAERIEGDAVDCVYEIDFGGNLKCRMKIVGNKINVEAAMNGWGDGISIDEIKITELKTPHHE